MGKMAFAGQGGEQFIEGRARPVGQAEIGSRLGERLGEPAAEYARSAGQDHFFSVKIHLACPHCQRGTERRSK